MQHNKVLANHRKHRRPISDLVDHSAQQQRKEAVPLSSSTTRYCNYHLVPPLSPHATHRVDRPFRWSLPSRCTRTTSLHQNSSPNHTFTFSKHIAAPNSNSVRALPVAMPSSSSLSLEFELSADVVQRMNSSAGEGVPSSSSSSSSSSSNKPVALAPGLTFQAYPGEILKGFLVVTTGEKALSLNEKGIDFHFRGFEKTAITTQVSSTNSDGSSSTSSETNYGGGDFFKFEGVTYQKGKARVFMPNTQTKFPFSFIVPQGVPPSTHVKLGDNGSKHNAGQLDEEVDQAWLSKSQGLAPAQETNSIEAEIKYEIRALAHVSGLFTSNIMSFTEIVVLPIYPTVPQQRGLQSVGLSVTKEYRAMLSKNQFVSAEMSIEKTQYALGEDIPIQVKVNNTHTKEPIDQIVIALQNEVIVSVKSGSLKQSTRYVTVSRHVYEVNIPPCTQSNTLEYHITAVNMTPDLQTAVMKCTSSLLVRVHVKKEKHHWVNLRIPLLEPYIPVQQPQRQPVVVEGIVVPHQLQLPPSYQSTVAVPSAPSTEGEVEGAPSSTYVTAPTIAETRTTIIMPQPMINLELDKPHS